MITAGASSADRTSAAHAAVQNRATHLALSKDGIMDINSKAAEVVEIATPSINLSDEGLHRMEFTV
jgi:hypothetical protein